MLDQVLSVSDFLAQLNQILENAYPLVMVKGEVSGYSDQRHIYFTLKDEEAALRCFMWAHALKQPIEDGMQVVVTGRPRLHNQYGFSINVDAVEPAGEGALRRAFELLKRQLETEGLFAAERKRPLPRFPKTIGLVTALNSAAYRDFVKISNQRWGGVVVKALDVQVQGATAPEQLVAAIEYFNQSTPPVDILVIARGGGSPEDLQAFNTEPVARAIAGSRTPTAVGIGHEHDITLADLTADLRASTPSNVAELVVPDKSAVLANIANLLSQIEGGMNQELAAKVQILNHHLRVIDRFAPRLSESLGYFRGQIMQGWQRLTERRRQQLEGLERTVQHLDPQRVLKRGYAIARLGNQVLRSASQASVGDRLMLQLARGRLKTEVRDVEIEQK